MSERETVISARGLGKRYRIWTHHKPSSLSDRVEAVAASLRHRDPATERPKLREEIWALRDVDFEVARGEVLGVIGPNGGGKSTLLSILARITEPTEGMATIRGRVSSILEVGTGFHPELSGRDNVFLNGAILGMTRAETAMKFDEIVEFSGVRDFIDMPVKRYSSGMYVRLAFAVAANLDPEILLLDEVLAVGDRAFQEKCLTRIDEMTQHGQTVLFVSHDTTSVSRLCQRAIVLNEGRIGFAGDADEAIDHYLQSTVIGGGASAMQEREGTGEIRVARVTALGPDGESRVRADGPLTIRVELSASRPIAGRHVSVEIGIHNSLTGFLISLPTSLDPNRALDDVDISDGTVVTCALDEIPLRPGKYFVSVKIDRLAEVLDHVRHLGEFEIVPSDFFGTGIPASATHPAAVLARHQWTVETRAETAAAAGRRVEA
jgi:lipopolysaccharide transport system ATP-binding protein